MSKQEMQKESNFVSAVVYLHQATDDVENFLSTVYQTLTDHFKHFEILCVDDGCAPAMLEKVKTLADQMLNMEMTIVHMGRYQGLEKAMIAGMNFAIGDYVFEFDVPCADYDTKLIMDVYQKALSGYDIVSAVPLRKESRDSKMFYRLFNRYSDLAYPLCTETFRIISRRAINRIYDINKKIVFRRVAYASSGLKCAKVEYSPKETKTPIRMHEERLNRWNTGIDVLVLFSNAAFNFSLACSLIFSGFALLVALYTVFIFVVGRPIEGWTTTMLLISIAFFGLFAILSCLIKYLSLIIKLQVSRKEYIFESVEKVSKQ